MNAMPACDKLVVALDVPSANAGMQLADRLRGHAGMFKVGLENFTAEGPVLPRFLVAIGQKVFLDLKFHDIPNTVRAAARQAAQLGVSLLNVHACGGRKMMEAAREGAQSAATGGKEPPRVLAVTVLTSLESQDLNGLGFSGTPEEVVVRLALLAQKAGLDGVVASPREIQAIHAACGSRFLIVTPGIRPRSAASNDQSRIATPERAIQAGADYLVVGRPITEAADPVAAADAIVAEMDAALASKTLAE